MKKGILSLLIVLGFAISSATFASEKENSNHHATSYVNTYEVVITLVWEDSGTPVDPQDYQGGIYAYNTTTGEYTYAEEYNGVFYFEELEEGYYRFDGMDYYFVGIVSKLKTIDDDASFTLKVWSE